MPKMAGKLDIPLEEIISESKWRGRYNGQSSYSSRGSGRTREFGIGPDRRFFRNAVISPYPMQQMQVLKPVFPETVSSNLVSNPEEGTKLYVSNLDYGVSDHDIEILFSEVGGLRRHSIHYDKSGRSKGTAEVVYVRQSDAIEAMKRYNNCFLDGKPMRINFVGMNFITTASVPLSANSNEAFGKPPIGFSRVEGGGELGRRGYAKKEDRIKEVCATAKDLDADLEKYRLQAMRVD